MKGFSSSGSRLSKPQTLAQSRCRSVSISRRCRQVQLPSVPLENKPRAILERNALKWHSSRCSEMEQRQWAIMAQYAVKARFTSFARELQLYTPVYGIGAKGKRL
jgi:hypothetical protein